MMTRSVANVFVFLFNNISSKLDTLSSACAFVEALENIDANERALLLKAFSSESAMHDFRRRMDAYQTGFMDAQA